MRLVSLFAWGGAVGVLCGCGGGEGESTTASEVLAQTPAPTVLASGQGGPIFLAIDGPNIYWGNNQSGEIMTVPLAGGPAKVLAHAEAPRRVRALAGKVYFVDTQTGSVERVVETTGDVTVLATNQTQPFGLTVGTSAGAVYWTNAGTQSSGYRDGAVMGLALDAIGTGAPTMVASGQAQAMGLDVNASYVYWTSVVDKSVRRMKLGSGRIETVATRQNGPATLALDDQSAYWTNAYDGTLMGASIADGTVQTLASGQAGITAVVSDRTALYWTVAGQTDGQGKVMKMPVAGGAPVALASRLGQPAGIAVGDHDIVWADSTRGTISRLAK
jgi:hypothetical protein